MVFRQHNYCQFLLLFCRKQVSYVLLPQCYYVIKLYYDPHCRPNFNNSSFPLPQGADPGGAQLRAPPPDGRRREEAVARTAEGRAPRHQDQPRGGMVTRSWLLLLLLHHLAAHACLGDQGLLGGGHLHPVGSLDRRPRPQRQARQLGGVDCLPRGFRRRPGALQGVQGVTWRRYTHCHIHDTLSLASFEHALALSSLRFSSLALPSFLFLFSYSG